MHTNPPTHKHICTDKSTQRYTCSKKKIIKKHRDTQTHPHINKPKRTNKGTDRCLSERAMLDWNDRSSWVSPDWSSWVSRNQSSWVWVLLDRSKGDTLTDRCWWIEAREILVKSDLVGYDRCLWIGAREIDACGSKLGRSVLA